MIFSVLFDFHSQLGSPKTENSSHTRFSYVLSCLIHCSVLWDTKAGYLCQNGQSTIDNRPLEPLSGLYYIFFQSTLKKRSST